MFESILVVVRQQAVNWEHPETRPALLGAIIAQSLASMLAVMIAGSLAAAVKVNAYLLISYSCIDYIQCPDKTRIRRLHDSDDGCHVPPGEIAFCEPSYAFSFSPVRTRQD